MVWKDGWGEADAQRSRPAPILLILILPYPMEQAIAMRLLCALLFGGVLLVLAAGCDTDIAGDAFENQPPDTELSVRDSSLVDNLSNAERLSSTLFVSWTGTDPDGFVAAFEMRFFDEGSSPGPEADWVRTTSNDSLVLLPIPRGERIANVVFEVRAIDNEGARDPQPARTVFPIQNAPPTIRFSSFDLPPDTTFHIISFSWIAEDPEGLENLSRIEVSFNDTTTFTALPADAEFVTFVGNVNRGDASQTVAEAEVFIGRALRRASITVPGLRLDAKNTLYLRAVDATDTTSVREEFSWYVKKPKGPVLFVNDFRKAPFPTVQRYHVELLREYLPSDVAIDVWNITQPFVTGNVGNAPRSDALPPNAEPTLRLMMASWDYIYWVSTNTVNAVGGNNLPFTAGVLDVFFDQGGKMMVHTPITQPRNPEDNLGNPAILLLPLSELFLRPDTLQRMELGRGAAITAVQPLPGVAEPLPALVSDNFYINELPFFARGANNIPLYEAEYVYLTRGGTRGPWTTPRTIASISADRRVGLFALPLVNEQSGASLLKGADGDPDASRRAVKLILESLGFPKR